MTSNLASLKAKRKRAYDKALPFMMFVLGIATSLLASELMTVLHEMSKNYEDVKHSLYNWAIIIIVPITLGYVAWPIYKQYVKPLNDAEKALEAFENRKKSRKVR